MNRRSKPVDFTSRAPSYLTTSEVTGDRIDANSVGTVHPLRTKTVNVFVSPHSQIAGGILDTIPFLTTQRVSLSTAAQTLKGSDEGTHHDRLERDVASAAAYVRGELIAEMVDAGVTEHEARALLRPDVPIADDALMLTNGTTIERAAAADPAVVSSDRLELRLRTTLENELKNDNARPTDGSTTAVQERIKHEYGSELESMLADGIETGSERARTKALGKRLGSLPAGMPIAPVPGYWYATANVWYVNVTGTYQRFAVRTDRGRDSGSVSYLRDGSDAHLTHRGETRHLGHAEKISMQTETAVIVVVPPGPRGVGNTDGEPIQRSPGWDS